MRRHGNGANDTQVKISAGVLILPCIMLLALLLIAFPAAAAGGGGGEVAMTPPPSDTPSTVTIADEPGDEPYVSTIFIAKGPTEPLPDGPSLTVTVLVSLYPGDTPSTVTIADKPGDEPYVSTITVTVLMSLYPGGTPSTVTIVDEPGDEPGVSTIFIAKGPTEPLPDGPSLTVTVLVSLHPGDTPSTATIVNTPYVYTISLHPGDTPSTVTIVDKPGDEPYVYTISLHPGDTPSTVTIVDKPGDEPYVYTISLHPGDTPSTVTIVDKPGDEPYVYTISLHPGDTPSTATIVDKPGDKPYVYTIFIAKGPTEPPAEGPPDEGPPAKEPPAEEPPAEEPPAEEPPAEEPPAEEPPAEEPPAEEPFSHASYVLPPPSYPPSPHFGSPSYYSHQAYGTGVYKSGANILHWTRLNPHDPTSPYIRGGGVTVGIVDTGIDLDHPDFLRDNIVIGEGLPGGKTPSNIERFIQDQQGHGTAVAGIIGGTINPSEDIYFPRNIHGARGIRRDAVTGMAPEAKLLPINFTNPFGPTNLHIDRVYDYIASNNAFVVNNSWGLGNQFLRLEHAKDVCFHDRACWIAVPVIYSVRETPGLGTELISQKDSTAKYTASRYYRALYDAVVDDDLLLVFAAGNHGWNSERKYIRVCQSHRGNYKETPDNPLNCFSNSKAIEDINVDGNLTVSQVYYKQVRKKFTLHEETVIPFPDLNSVGLIAKMVADFHDELGGNWLNVVSVPQYHQNPRTKFSRFSNGCGLTKENCLAAWGDEVKTTRLHSPDDSPDDPNRFDASYVDTRQGTSFAAPQVSGAAALLKGAFPNLTPQDVVHILLQSADGLGSCAPAEGEKEDKTVSCADDLFGHGLLNVVDAFTPTTFVRVAGPDSVVSGEGAFLLADSRIRLSPAFGAAAWQKESLALGGLDNYGRVYYTQMDLSAGAFVVKPLWEDGDINRGGIHESYSSPLLRAQQSAAFTAQERLAGGQWQGQQDSMDYALNYGARAQQHAIGWQQGAGRLSWSYLSGSDDTASGFNTHGNSWRLPFSASAMHQFAGEYNLSAAGSADGKLPQVGISYGRSEDDGISQLASYAKWGDDDSGSLRLEGGYVQEKDSVLGASFEGGFALSTGETFYQRLSGRRQLFGVEWVADYVHARSKAAGDGGIVQSLKARSDAWMVGANRGHWSLQWSQPLAINAGSMALSYISGYTESGDYAITDKRLDISSGNRLQRTTLLYMREATDGLTFAFSLDYLRNAPHRDYRKDAVIGAAALRYTF